MLEGMEVGEDIGHVVVRNVEGELKDYVTPISLTCFLLIGSQSIVFT